MYGHNVNAMSPVMGPQGRFSFRNEPEEPESLDWCEVCKGFTVFVTAIGFVSSLIGSLYFLFVDHGPPYFVLSLVSAIICLFVFVYLIASENQSLHSGSPFRAGVRSLETMRDWRISESGRVTISGRGEPTLALPAYIVIPEGKPVESSRASTESTLSADEGREEEAGGSSKADVKPLGGKELGKATKTVAKAVTETLAGKGGAGSSELSAEARRGLRGVRPRRQSPVQPQNPVSSPEDAKTK